MKAIGMIMFLFYSILGVEITPSLNTAEPAPVPEQYVYEEPSAINAPAENPSDETAALDVKTLAQCLTDSGAKFYGAFWCGHCQSQKELFGENLQYVAYVECDERGENPDPQACAEAGIRAFPTWILGDGTELVGTQQLEALAAKTSC